MFSPKCSVSPAAGWADDPLTRAASDSDRDTTAGAPNSGCFRGSKPAEFRCRFDGHEFPSEKNGFQTAGHEFFHIFLHEIG